MTNIDFLSILRTDKGITRKAAWLSVLALTQGLLLSSEMTAPALAANSVVNSAAGAMASPPLPTPQSPMEATPAPAVLVTPSTAAAGLEQSVQATMVPSGSSETLSGDIYNFAVVSQGLWRGSQPSHKAIANLAKGGVKTIIDLRYAGAGCDEEAIVAKQYGINYINIPLGFEHPSLGNVAKFLAIVSKPSNQPVFLHCRQGADRTGTLVGVFRVLHDHWSFAEAYDEMRLHHFKPFLVNLKSIVARCSTDPIMSKELSEMASKLEETAPATKVSVKSLPGNI